MDDDVKVMFREIKDTLKDIKQGQEKQWEKYDEHTTEITEIKVNLGSMKGWIGGILASCTLVATLRWIFP
jgi:hypothetical protein